MFSHLLGLLLLLLLMCYDFLNAAWLIWPFLSRLDPVCVYLCVWEREIERGRERDGQITQCNATEKDREKQEIWRKSYTPPNDSGGAINDWQCSMDLLCFCLCWCLCVLDILNSRECLHEYNSVVISISQCCATYFCDQSIRISFFFSMTRLPCAHSYQTGLCPLKFVRLYSALQNG